MAGDQIPLQSDRRAAVGDLGDELQTADGTGVDHIAQLVRAHDSSTEQLVADCYARISINEAQ